METYSAHILTRQPTREKISLNKKAKPSLPKPTRHIGAAGVQFHSFLTSVLDRGKGKGKSVPLQAWTGPEGSRKLRFPDFVKTAQDGDKVVSLTHRPPLLPGNTPGPQFC